MFLGGITYDNHFDNFISFTYAPCGITYDSHSDDFIGIIYAPRVINYAPRERYSTRVTHD
jgi:hypothetical protein